MGAGSCAPCSAGDARGADAIASVNCPRRIYYTRCHSTGSCGGSRCLHRRGRLAAGRGEEEAADFLLHCGKQLQRERWRWFRRPQEWRPRLHHALGRLSTSFDLLVSFAGASCTRLGRSLDCSPTRDAASAPPALGRVRRRVREPAASHALPRGLGAPRRLATAAWHRTTWSTVRRSRAARRPRQQLGGSGQVRPRVAGRWRCKRGGSGRRGGRGGGKRRSMATEREAEGAAAAQRPPAR